MNFKTFLAIICILLVAGIASAAYATYVHSAFKIGDGKDIDLAGNRIGNGSSTCTNFKFCIDNNTGIVKSVSGINQTLLASGDAVSIFNTISSGDTVYVRNGYYNLSANISILSSNVAIICENKYNTKIRLNNGVEKDVITIGDNLNSYNNIKISNCNINGNMAGQTTNWGTNPANGLMGINVKRGVSNMEISSNIIKNINAWGINAEAGSIITYANYRFNENEIDTTGDSGIRVSLSNTVFERGNKIYNVGDDGDAFDNYKVINSVISDNIVYNSTGTCTGIYAESKNITFANNICTNILNRGVYIGKFTTSTLPSENIKILNNHIEMNNTGDRYGIWLNDGVTSNSVIGNTIINGQIKLSQSSFFVDNNLISQNFISNAPWDAISLTLSSDNTISNNRIFKSGTNSIMLKNSDHNQIINNDVRGSSQTSNNTNYDIFINDSSYNQISGNLLKYLGTDRAKYGIYEKNNSDFNIISNNIIIGAWITNINRTNMSTYYQNYGDPGYFYGTNNTDPNILSNYKPGDTYFNSTKNSMCVYTTSWVFIGNSTGKC